LTTGERSGVIESGDLDAAVATKVKGKTPKDKKISTEQRTTTPYMTKYERARILGTRALQIRLVGICFGCHSMEVCLIRFLV
jgi:DNA-directed RNA polymerases I, II, and III subunit RPABC2